MTNGIESQSGETPIPQQGFLLIILPKYEESTGKYLIFGVYNPYLPMKKSVSLLLLGLFTGVCLYGQAVDSLLAVYQSGDRKASIQAANALSQTLFDEGCSDAPSIFLRKTDSLLVQAKLFAPLSDWFFSQQRYGDALSCARRALAASDAIGDESLAAQSCSTLAACSQQFGDFKEAMEYAQRCYEIDVRLSDTLALSSSLNNLAVICLSAGHDQEAKEYIDKAVALERPLGRADVLAIRLGVASEVNTALGRYDEALGMANEAYSLNKDSGNDARAAVRLCQIAAVHQKKRDLEEARRLYLEALDPLEKSGNIRSLSICLNSLGVISEVQHRYADAEHFFLRVLDLSEGKDSYLLQEKKACDALADLYGSTRPEKAVAFYKRSAILRDSLFNEASERQINNFNTLYETREKEHRIELQQVHIERQRAAQHWLIVAMALSALLAFLLVIFARQQRNRYREQKSINEVKNKFYSLISHDLKNPVIAQRNALQIISEHFEEIPTAELQCQCNELSKSAESLLELVYNLLNWSRMESGRIRCETLRFDLRQVVDDAIVAIDNQAKAKSLSVKVESEPQPIARADRNMINTVLRNLLGNAVKFSYEGSEIVVAIVSGGNMWRVSVTDHGIGMDEATAASLFKLNPVLTRGTNAEQGSGLGLLICREMVEYNGGKIGVLSRKGEGTTVYFTINADVNGR